MCFLSVYVCLFFLFVSLLVFFVNITSVDCCLASYISLSAKVSRLNNSRDDGRLLCLHNLCILFVFFSLLVLLSSVFFPPCKLSGADVTAPLAGLTCTLQHLINYGSAMMRSASKNPLSKHKKQSVSISCARGLQVFCERTGS